MIDATTQKTYMGVDLGGTKLLVGEADTSGKILYYKRYSSGYLSQQQALAHIQNAADDYMANVRPKSAPPPAGMGIGVVGRVDTCSGTWFQIDKQRTDEVPLAMLLRQRYNMPCTIDNDVRSATLAEKYFGYGKKCQDFIYLNAGTGLAAGIVSGGKIIRGGHFNSGEVGHTQVGIHVGVPCECGRENCAEAIAAGSGIDKCARLFAPNYPNTVLNIPPVGTRVNVGEVFANADNDELCELLCDNAAKALANLVMNLARTTDPVTIVLGGGVMSDGLLYPRIQKYLHANTMRFVTGGVVLTQLDAEFIGLLGACTLAISQQF